MKKDKENENFDIDNMAVALEYEPDISDTPKIVASGKGYIAEQILEIARANSITIREDPDLVAILNAVEINTEIPLEAFAAVAEILAYIYKVTNEKPDWLMDGIIELEQNKNLP
ncbi:MAG: EscU/YscU/HrcU family type III secretion system export apparatus switch protein [Alphaproteobacteria bacterium]|nr:EscU/YscU/HrcU family type III secretion system export apparatus switch protein [Alphaproteobacteria bacterium]